MGPLLDGLGSRSCWHGLDADMACPTIRHHTHAFRRDHLRFLRDRHGSDRADRLDALAMDNNDTVANRLATKTVNERAADESLKAP